jgi:hypothetical protein
MSVWRKIASGLLTLGAALIGFLLASRRGASSPQQREAGAEAQKQVDELRARMAATQQAVVAEEQKQRELAKERARLDEDLVQVDVRVEGLSHDNLDAEIHRALDGGAGNPAAPVIVKPGDVIKPAN